MKLALIKHCGSDNPLDVMLASLMGAKYLFTLELIVVGFYLINMGFVSLFLKFGAKPHDLVESIEYISSKVGVVILVLGVMHFFNMYNISRMRGKALRRSVVNTAVESEQPLADQA